MIQANLFLTERFYHILLDLSKKSVKKIKKGRLPKRPFFKKTTFYTIA